ncbi:hypothetical protein [Lachnospira sp.]|jgi:hypothetical protein|uniref:hypothetical protein n=1 Tax=Lachnospira sp. TaxID=2049031 RepID=UPI00257E1EFB|nr:hypothetical protein [Lachnospira sp.]
MQIVDPKISILEQGGSNIILDNNSTPEDISKIQGELFEHMITHLEKCNEICLKNPLKDSVEKGDSLDILEHGTIYLTVPIGKPDPKTTEDYMRRMQLVNFYQNNPESVVKGYKSDEDGVLYVYFITTNYRVVVENNRHSDLLFLYNYSEYHVKRSTYSIITNKYIADKLSKIKYLSVSQSIPIIEDDELILTSHIFDNNSDLKNKWIESCKESYKIYKELVNNGVSESNAYKILPDTIRVNVVVTAFNEDFENLFKTLEFEDDVDYCDIVHMIAYDYDNLKISEEIADEMVQENSEESGEVEAVEDSEGEPVIPE